MTEAKASVDAIGTRSDLSTENVRVEFEDGIAWLP